MKVSFQLESSDFAAFARAVKNSSNSMIWMVPLFLFLLQGFQAFADRRVRVRFALFGWKALMPQIQMLLMTLVFFAAFYALMQWVGKNAMRKDLREMGTVTFVADDEGVSTATQKGRDTIFWRSVENIIETDAHFFILNAPQTGLIVPKRAFAGEESVNFGHFLQQKWAPHRKNVAPIAEVEN
ncbi:MAG TPA: YcxB family protein [Abditibacterium sp.]